MAVSELPEWAEPGTYEVSPGVYRIPLPLPTDGLRAVNVYAIAAGERVVLVDAGWALADSQEQLGRALDTIGYGFEHVSRFLVTHAHRDHYTQAVALRRNFGTPVSVGSGERPTLEWLSSARRRGPTNQRERLTSCGAADILAELDQLPEDNRADPKNWELPDTWLDGSALLPVGGRTLRAIPTPGHTQGHYAFLDADADVLFAGDHVLPHITPSIGFEAVTGESPLGDYLASLLLVRTMPDTRLLPAHGPVADSVHARVDELLDHHGTRLDATHAAVVAGAATSREAAGRLTWTRRERTFAELDPYNRMLAVLETRAHLDVLVERGVLVRAEIAGVLHYRT